MRTIGLDWSRTEVVIYDGATIHRALNLTEAATLFPNCRWILEAPAESYELQNRQIVLDAFMLHGIEAWSYRSQYTAKYREKWGIEKSDEADAQVIYRIGTETTLALKRFGPLRDVDAIRDSIKEFLVEDRYLFNGMKSRSLTSLVQRPPVVLLPFLFTGKKYRMQIGRIIAVALEVQKANRGFREFRRQLGNYSNGYRSMPRSEFYHWLVGPITLKAVRKGEDQNIARKRVMRMADKLIKYLWKISKAGDAILATPAQANLFLPNISIGENNA